MYLMHESTFKWQDIAVLISPERTPSGFLHALSILRLYSVVCAVINTLQILYDLGPVVPRAG